ncbi:SgcJ/EcaC family oxidoreductase [Chloroflexi bacterium TSY]|nr:SgcJ/EcaC family oxidoreductase [Chloroflexi bacterium TSY]
MAGQTPVETVNQLINAFHSGDVTAAVSLYEPDGVLVIEPGKVARGTEELRPAIENIVALKPTLVTESYEVLVTGDVALYSSRWRLNGTAPDGSSVEEGGTSTDILRRAADGTWLVAIDNPLGEAIVG